MRPDDGFARVFPDGRLLFQGQVLRCVLGKGGVVPATVKREGDGATPAARMPQTAREVVKDRARRLREKGAQRLRLHLEAQQGRILEVLTERGGIARARDFTMVKVGDVAPGQLRSAKIVSQERERLIGMLDIA